MLAYFRAFPRRKIGAGIAAAAPNEKLGAAAAIPYAKLILVERN
jgi:hypothetical protein